MKKVILWASVTVLVIVLSVVFFAYRGKQDPEADVPVRKQKV